MSFWESWDKAHERERGADATRRYDGDHRQRGVAASKAGERGDYGGEHELGDAEQCSGRAGDVRMVGERERQRVRLDEAPAEEEEDERRHDSDEARAAKRHHRDERQRSDHEDQRVRLRAGGVANGLEQVCVDLRCRSP